MGVRDARVSGCAIVCVLMCPCFLLCPLLSQHQVCALTPRFCLTCRCYGCIDCTTYPRAPVEFTGMSLTLDSGAPAAVSWIVSLPHARHSLTPHVIHLPHTRHSLTPHTSFTYLTHVIRTRTLKSMHAHASNVLRRLICQSHVLHSVWSCRFCALSCTKTT